MADCAKSQITRPFALPHDEICIGPAQNSAPSIATDHPAFTARQLHRESSLPFRYSNPSKNCAEPRINAAVGELPGLQSCVRRSGAPGVLTCRLNIPHWRKRGIQAYRNRQLRRHVMTNSMGRSMVVVWGARRCMRNEVTIQ